MLLAGVGARTGVFPIVSFPLPVAAGRTARDQETSLVLLTPFRSLRSLLGYGLAIGSVLSILLITAALGLVMQQGSLVIFVAAIALTALYGGFGPGLLATVLSLGAILA